MKIRILFVLILFFSINAFSQEIDPIDHFHSDSIYDIDMGVDEVDDDEESMEVEVKDEVSKQSVKFCEDLLCYINILRDKDSLVYHFSRTMGDNEILPIVDGINKLDIDRKFEVIFHPNTDKVLYVREMILNENQAWDYIYENIFDENGNGRLFIRHYSTFKSVCAEVAFELSEYFFNENNDLIKKTYAAFDGQQHPLDIDDCWMDREEYLKCKNFNELNSRFNFPLEGLLGNNPQDKENKDFDDKRELIDSIDPIQE